MFTNCPFVVGNFLTEQPADFAAVQFQTFVALQGRIFWKHLVAVHPIVVALFVGGFSQLTRAELLATGALVAAAVSGVFQ